jgi:hypothetical protein
MVSLMWTKGARVVGGMVISGEIRGSPPGAFPGGGLAAEKLVRELCLRNGGDHGTAGTQVAPSDTAPPLYQ